MEIANLQHGKILTLDVVPFVDVRIDRIPPNGRELILTRVGDLCALILPGQDEPLVVEARDQKGQRDLQRSMEHDAPRLCWLVRMHSERNQLVALTVQIHEFSERFSIPELRIGVDEKLVADMERKQAHRFSTENACAWLADKLIIPSNSPTGLARVIIVGRPDSQNSQKHAFRILGDHFALDVERQEEGGWLAFRLTRPKSASKPEEYRPVILAEGGFEFVDQTIAGKMRQGMATELDQIVRTAGSYLRIWLDYQAMEHRRIVEDAKRFGWLSYDGRYRLPDGCWSFQLTADSQWTPSQLWQGIITDKDLEASAEIPDMLTRTSGDDGDSSSFQMTVRESRPAFRGALAGSDAQSIRLRPDTQDGVVPPERGYIHVSLRGDLKRMARRTEAHSRIASGKTSIPQLALLLENRPVPVRRVQTHEPLSGAAKARFHSGAPTPRQEEAIRVALNTPDIAVIQGPPGTGKTRTISAIIERLTEIAKNQNADFDKVLLTSFQHDAVENAAAMTEIFGLPAMKVGRRRGDNSESLPLIAWTNRIAEALEADLAASPKKPLRKLLETIRIRHAAYVKSPGTETEAARMLLDLGSLAGEHLPAALSDRVISVADHLKLGVAGLDDERQAAIQVVRGLRLQKEAFADDGPKMAWRVLNQLESGPWLTDEDRAILEKARDWDSPSSPDFLTAMELLRNRLLDTLQVSTPPSRTPLVNSEVINVLDEIISTLDKCVRNAAAEGPDMVLEQLIQDLRNDPVGLRKTVENYTVVLAATCQQAVSDRMMEMLSDDLEFENVIVDEAARANPLDLLIPLSRAARRIILVGDHRQLPHLLEPEVERELEQSVRDETRDQIRKSLFERLFVHVKDLEKVDGIKRWVTLDTQYRMHPVLGAFVSDAFYKDHGEAFFSPEGADLDPQFAHGLGGSYEGKLAVWKNLPVANGAEERVGHSWRRHCEADWIAAEARHILQESPGLSVGIISFYAAQVEAIMTAMQRVDLTTLSDDGDLIIADAWRNTLNAQREVCERLRVGTVDAFQGKEFDVVILSLTRSNRIQPAGDKSVRRKFGHLLLENRLCVAMSRQKRLLITVGDSAMGSEELSQFVPGLHAFQRLCRSSHGAII
ncbi:MAG: AAA domain-containing protein [Verrucomicrobiota bacterium]|jgi:hypothetical protein